MSGMQQKAARSGGIFVMIAIVGGAAWGIATGNPMNGIVIGTSLGIAAAIVIWLLDRRR